MNRYLNISPIGSNVYNYTNFYYLTEFLKQVQSFDQEIIYPKCEYFKPDRFMGLLRSIESNQEQLLADMKHIISIFILHGPEIQEEEKKTGRAGREFSKFRFKLKRKYRLVRAKVDRRIVDSKSITLGRIAQVFPLLVCQGMFRRNFKCAVASSQLTPNYPDVMKTTAFSSLIPHNAGDMLKDVIVKAHRIFLFEFERNTNTKRPEYSLKTKNKIFRLQETRTRGNVIPEAKRLEYCERWNIITRRVLDRGYDVTQPVTDVDFYKFFVRPGDPIGQTYPSRIRGGCAEYVDEDVIYHDDADENRESNDAIFENPDYSDYVPTESVWIAAKRYDRLFLDVDPKHSKKLPETLIEAFPVSDSVPQPSTSRNEYSTTNRYQPLFPKIEDEVNCFPVGQYRENSPPLLVGNSHNIDIQRTSSLSDFMITDVTKAQWGSCDTPTWNTHVEGTGNASGTDSRLLDQRQERYVATQEVEQSGEEDRPEGSIKRRLTFETREQAELTRNVSAESPSTRSVLAGEEVQLVENVSVIEEPTPEQSTAEKESILSQLKQPPAEKLLVSLDIKVFKELQSQLLSRQSERNSSPKTIEEDLSKDENTQSVDDQILPSQPDIETEETAPELLEEQLSSGQPDSEDEIVKVLEELSTDHQLFRDRSPNRVEAANALVQLSRGPRTPPGTPPKTPESLETPVPPSTPRTPETLEMLEPPSTETKLHKKSKSKSKKKHMNIRQKKKDKTRHKKKHKKKDPSVKITDSEEVQGKQPNLLSSIDRGEETETADSDTSCADKSGVYLAKSVEAQEDLDEITKRVKECDLEKGNETEKDKSEIITLESLGCNFKKLELFEKKMKGLEEKKRQNIESSSRFDLFQRTIEQYEKEEAEKAASRELKLRDCNVPVQHVSVQNNSRINENLVIPDIIITEAGTEKKRDNIEGEKEVWYDEATNDYLRIVTPTGSKLNTSFHEETGEVSDTEETNIKRDDDAKKNAEDFVYPQETENSRKKKVENEDDTNRIQEEETGEKIRKQDKKKKKNRKLPATVENVNLTFMREVIALYCNYENLERIWATEITYPSEAPGV